jgi:hypothetical protein
MSARKYGGSLIEIIRKVESRNCSIGYRYVAGSTPAHRHEGGLACVHLGRNNLISAGPVAGSPVVYAAHRAVPVLLGSGS